MVQDPTRVSPGDYSAKAYDVLSKYDPAFPENVSVETFFESLQNLDYAAKAYALLADADPELVNNLSLDDFIGNVKKKEEPVVTESVLDAGSSALLPSTEIPEGALERKVNQFGQEVDELGVVLPQSDSPFELTDYRNRRKQAVTQQDTAAIRPADQVQAEEIERAQAVASMPDVPALEGREAPDYVAQLREAYGPYGVRFETSTALGLGEFGSIKAYAVGADGNAVEYNIAIVDGKIMEGQLGGLNEFLQSNARAKGGVDVDKRSLSEKALKVQEMRPVARLNEDGRQSTVLMASAEADGRHFAYPTLFPSGDGFSADPDDWTELEGDAAFDEAQRRGELFEFDTAEEANRFAEGEWKEIRETDAIAEKMWAEKGRNYHADNMFLRRVEEAKKEYEFLESIVPGEQLVTGRMSDRYLDETEIPPAYQQYLTTYTDERGEKKLIARTDIEEIRQQKERELAALEQQFDDDNELLQLKEDYDEYLGQKRGEVMERAATLNQEGKSIQNSADVASINRFGVPVKGLLSMQPETEAEYNEMLGLLTQYNTGIEQRQVAALQYEKNKLYYDAQHEKLINQEYVDGWEEVWMKAKNGWSRGKAMSRLMLIHYGYYDAIGDEGAEERAMREVSEIMDSMDTTRVGRATSRTNMTGTTESFLERINPMDAGMDAATYTAALTAESLGQLLPIWFRILPVAAAGGAAYGAAGGPLGSAFGTATTTLGAAGMGALAAVTTVGMPISELALEMGNAILEVGEKKGYDWADPNSALLALNDKSVWEEGADRGYKRGVPIMLTGMAGNMVMAKFALGGSRVLPLAERMAIAVGTGVTVEPVTEMFGEYLALKATGEYTGSTANVKEIAAEGLGAIGMGVGFTTSIAAFGYAKDVVTDANFNLAVALMDPTQLAKENVRGERIVSWANRMERLGKLNAEQAEQIRKNVGLRRQANELLGKKVDSRPGGDSQVTGRIMELLEAKQELEKSGPNVFGEKIRSITEEIAIIAESGKVEKPGGAAVNLSDIRGRIRNRRAGIYKFNGKTVTREDFRAKIEEATPRQLKRARAYNDIEAQLELKAKRDAIQERGTTEVPVGKRAGLGPEVDEEVREATQEDLQAEEEGSLDTDRKGVILETIAEKLNDGVELTEVEQSFLEDNKEDIEANQERIKILDQEAAEVEVLGEPEVEGRVPLKRLRRLASNAKKAMAKNFEGANIIIHADKDSYQQAAQENGLTGERSAGFLGTDNKTVHVFAPLASETTIAHETFHVVLRNSVDKAQTQELMGEFVTTLKKVIPADKPLAAKLDEFQKLYDAGQMNEEYVAEFFGELAAAYPTLDKKGKSVIARFLERLSKLLGLDLTLSPDLTKLDQQVLSLLERLAGQVSRGETITARETGELSEMARSTSRKQTEDNLSAAEQRVSDFTMKEIAGMSDNGVVGHFTNESFDKFLPKFMKTGVYGAGFYFTGSTIIGKHYGKGPNATIAFVDINDMNLVDRDRVATREELQAAANWLVDNDKVFITRFMPEDISPIDAAMMNLTSPPQNSNSERRAKMNDTPTLGQLQANLQYNFDEYIIEDDMGVITPVFNEVYPEYQGIINMETEQGTIMDMVIWDFDAINNNIVKPTKQFAEAAAEGKVSVADFTEIVYEPTVTPEERMAEMEEEMIRTKPETEAALRAAEQRVDDFSDEQIQAMADEGVVFHFGKVDITKVLPEKLKRFVLGYGFYFTNYALSDSTYRNFGDRFTMVNVDDFNLLDGDTPITEEQAKALRDAAKTELQEAEEYGDDLGFEESQVLMSLADTKANELWGTTLTSARNDERSLVGLLSDEQKATTTRLVQEMLGFDGVVYGQPMAKDKTGAVTVVWNFPKIDRAIIEPGQEPTRAAEQRVDVESNEDNSFTFRTEGGRVDAFADGNVVTLDNIAVSPEAQRQGVATRLVRAVMDEFRDQQSLAVIDEDGNTIEEPSPYVIGFDTRVTPQGDAFYDSIIDEVEEFNRRNDGPPSFNEDGLPEVRAAEQRVDDLETSIDKSVGFAEESTFDNKIEFKRALQERFNQLVLPELEARYGITDSSELNDSLKEYLVDAYMNETLNAIAAYPDALGWYDSRITGAMSLMSLLHPELATDPDAASAFKIGLAITSNGNKVYDNFVEANRQYKYYNENGRFDESRSIGNQVGGILSNLKFANEALGVMSMAELTQFLTTKHKVGSLSYRDSAGKKKNLISGFGVNEEVYGAAVFGPKIGNGFFMNLYGVFDQLTMDRWFMRQYGRLTGTLLDFDQKKVDTATKRLARARKALLQRNSAKVEGLIGAFESLSDAELAQKVQKASVDIKKRAVLKSSPKLDEFRKASNNLAKLLEAEVEAPTPAKRRFINEVFSELQQKLKDENGIDITIADLQAVNWYPEKALYQTFKADQTQKSAKTETSDNEQPDYESAARKLVEKQGVTKAQIDGRQIERDDTARDADQQRAAELLEDDEATSQLRDRILSIREDVTTDDLKAAEQRVDVDTEAKAAEQKAVENLRGVEQKASEFANNRIKELGKNGILAHFTSSEFEQFKPGFGRVQFFGEGIYFTNEKVYADRFSDVNTRVAFVDVSNMTLMGMADGKRRFVDPSDYDTISNIVNEIGSASDAELFAEVVSERGGIKTDLFRGFETGIETNLYDLQYRLVELGLAFETAKSKVDRNINPEANAGQFVRPVFNAIAPEYQGILNRGIGFQDVVIWDFDAINKNIVSDVSSKMGTEAAEQRVVDPGVVDVLERYEFKPNKSLKNAELAPELNRNLQRFGYGVKQYGTRMNDFRVISLDTGRAVDPNDIIAAGVEERAARLEEERRMLEMERQRELEQRIIEIYNADERPFTGKDFEARGVEQKVAAKAMAEPGTIADLVARGRELGLRDAAIRSVLLKRFGKDNADAINTALTEYFDMFRAIPEAFGNVEGGIEVGRQIYDDVRRQLDEFARPKKPERMTKRERTDRIEELRAKFPEQKNLSDTELLRKHPRQAVAPSIAEVRAEALNMLRNNSSFNEQTTEVQEQLLVAFDKTLQTKANKRVNTLMAEIRNNIRQRRKGESSAKAVRNELRKVINELLPAGKYTKAEAKAIATLVSNVTEKNMLVQIQKVTDLLEKKAKADIKAELRDIKKLDSRIRSERKYAEREARKVQNNLRKLINEVIPRADYGKADIAKLTRLVASVNEINYDEKAEQVLEVVEKKRGQIRDSLVRDIAKFVAKSAKTKRTPSGKVRPRSLDAPGQAYFREANRILRAILNKDQSLIMDIAANLANNPMVDVATQKMLNGEKLTMREQQLVDQKSALDMFAGIQDKSLEEVESILEDLKVDVGFSRANLKATRAARAARMAEFREGAKAEVQDNWAGFATNEDGSAKTRNQLEADKTQKKTIGDALKENGLRAKYDALVEWAKEGKRLTPAGIARNAANITHVGALTGIMGEYFRENLYKRLGKMEERHLKGVFETKDKLDEMASTIEGIENYKDITDLIFTSNPDGLMVNTKATGRRKLSTDEMMRIYALSKNPVQRAKLEAMGFTDEVMNEIVDAVDNRLLEFVDKTVDYLANDYYEGINDVYSKVNDINLGYIENYFPTRTQVKGDLSVKSKEETLSSTFFGPNAQVATALKERTDQKGEILMSQDLGFHGELGNHFNTMERFKAYAEGVQEMNAILSSDYTVALSGRLRADAMLNMLIAHGVTPDMFMSDMSFKSVDALISNYTGASLAFKLMQIPKQATSFIGGFQQYRFGDKPNPVTDLIMFFFDYAVLLPQIMLEGVTLGKYKGPIASIAKDSATFRARLESNFSGDVYGLTAGVSGRPRKVSAKDYKLHRKAATALRKGSGTATAFGDIMGVLGYLPAYNRNRMRGMSQEEAVDLLNEYNETQQSRRPGERTPLQIRQNGLTRAFMAFTSSQILYLNNTLRHANNINKAIRKGEKVKAVDSRGLIFNAFMSSVLFTLASNIFVLLFGNDEEKERAFYDTLASPIKNLFSIPIWGAALEEFYNLYVGNKYPTDVAINPLGKVVREVKKVATGGEVSTAIKEVGELALGTNFDPGLSLINIAAGEPIEPELYNLIGVPKSQRPED